MADTYVVERDTSIDAAPQAVFDLIADLTQYDQWSPWSDLDPNMTVTHTGEPATVGSGYAWTGNRKVGAGSMKITELDEPGRVSVDLKFLKPFKAENTVDWLVVPAGDGSKVTWRMTGERTFMTKVMGFFGKTMDKMVGPDFEKGLAKLKSAVEAG